jgi:hypothetical protein
MLAVSKRHRADTPPHVVLSLCIELRDLTQQVAKRGTQALIHCLRKCASCKAQHFG